MPSFMFDDVLRTANGHLDSDIWNGPGKWTLWEMSAKCKARKEFDIAHNKKWQNEWKADKDGKNEKESKSEKSQTNFKWSKEGVKYGFGLISDAMKMSVEGNLYNDGWKVDGKGEYEWKYSKAEWKAKCNVAVCSPVMAEKMRIWINVDGDINEKSDMGVLAKMNVNYDQYHFGVAAENKAGDWSKQFVHVVKNDKEQQYFARMNLKTNDIGVGCSIDHDSFSHSYEGTLAMGEKAEEGIAGTPLEIVGGGEYELSKNQSVGYTFKIGQGFEYNQTVEHKVDDKITIAINQAFDSSCLEKDRKKPAYDFGFGLTYKL